MAKQIVGSIETGGTKIRCALALCDQGQQMRPQLLHQGQFSTAEPALAIAQIVRYFEQRQADLQHSPTAQKSQVTEIAAIGVACFGPIDLRAQSPTFGHITTTPKTAWRNCNFVGALQQHFDVPIGWDTDVNAPALAESLWGAGRRQDPVLYITVGTGLGGGAVVNGKPVHGLLHPEMGHILVRSHQQDGFRGCCPSHDFCLEGMASGTSIEARWQQRAQDLPPDHIAWEMEAYYLAQGLYSYILTLSPQKIIIGGGVMQQEHLRTRTTAQLHKLLNGYIQAEELQSAQSLASFICPPALGNEVGLYGGLALAVQALETALQR